MLVGSAVVAAISMIAVIAAYFMFAQLSTKKTRMAATIRVQTERFSCDKGNVSAVAQLQNSCAVH